MKKLLVLLICLSLCTSIFLSCNAKEPPAEDPAVSVEDAMAGIAQFFVNEGLVPGLSDKNLLLEVDKYSYEGKKISEIVSAYYVCGDTVDRLEANGELFGYGNRRSQDTGIVDDTTSFYSKVPLDGLTLPLEIAFGDSLETVCKKMGLSEESNQGLVSGEKKTLYQNGQVTVTLLYHEEVKEGASVQLDVRYSYVLQYQKVYESTSTNGKPVTVTETMKFSFVGEGDHLACFYVAVNENYEP
ncbi:MAG: hypothetical protein IJX28_08560 [Clostridia bacterium]|nr:hypothetical protein [Clostridia bacterium]